MMQQIIEAQLQKKKAKSVVKERHIALGSPDTKGNVIQMKLRRIIFVGDDG
ncbi:MAG TPA: hypothetical protein VGP55_12770 [Chitinophagaceae bacterium]|nr:hypothetical protein [Chitinophagaceae bacterium]